jgi:hypothetical protein
MENTNLKKRVLKYILPLFVACLYSYGVSSQELQKVSVKKIYKKTQNFEETLLLSRAAMFETLDYSHISESESDIVSTGDKIALEDKYPEYTVLRNQWTSFWRTFVADYPEVQRENLSATLVKFAGAAQTTKQAMMFYVASDGDDNNEGSKNAPFSSFERAKTAVRELIKEGLKSPVSVIIIEGNYFFSDPLFLTIDDSGTKENPITWEAATNEKVVISGNMRIESEWKTEDNKIYYTDISNWDNIKSYYRAGRTGEAIPNHPWHFRQLFVNGERQQIARYPNSDFLFLTETNYDKPEILYVNAEDVKKSWEDDPQAEIFLYEKTGWFNTLTFLRDVKSESGKTFFVRDGYEMWGTRENNRYYVFNIHEELDSPGEWYLDYQKGRLYYYPKDGTMKNKIVEAPLTHSLLEVGDDVNKNKQVSNITIKGFCFEGTDYTTDPWGWRTHPDAAVILKNTHHVTVEKNLFNNIGGYGVRLYQDCLLNKIYDNEVVNAGCGGVMLTGSIVGRRGTLPQLKKGSKAHFVYPILNLIRSNHVHHSGKFRKYVAGVTGDPRNEFMILSPGNVIDHNLFHDMPRAGVFLFQNCGGDVIEYNHMYELMQETNDGGAIHLYSGHLYGQPSQIRYNLVHNVGTEKLWCRGIYLDGSINRMLVENNVVYEVGGRGSVLVCTKGIRNTFQNNILVNSWAVKTSSRAYYDHQVFKQNVCVNIADYSKYYVDHLHSITLIDQKNYQAGMDKNIIWMGEKPVISLDKKKYHNWKEWQAAGWDKQSIIEDPLLIDIKRPYLGLKANSPAFKMGFKQIDMSKTGLLNR